MLCTVCLFSDYCEPQELCISRPDLSLDQQKSEVLTMESNTNIVIQSSCPKIFKLPSSGNGWLNILHRILATATTASQQKSINAPWKFLSLDWIYSEFLGPLPQDQHHSLVEAIYRSSADLKTI